MTGHGGVNFFKWISLITLYRLTSNNQIWQDNTRGEGRISRGQPHPYRTARVVSKRSPISGFKKAGSQCSPILGVSFLFMRTRHSITKFDVVTRGEDVYLEIIHASHLNRVKFQSSPIFMYLFPNPLTQDDQIPHGNTSGEEHVG